MSYSALPGSSALPAAYEVPGTGMIARIDHPDPADIPTHRQVACAQPTREG